VLKVVRCPSGRQSDGQSDAVLVPVPTATSRVRARGYDQSKLLARAVARRQSLPVLNCLARHGQTHQVGATRQQRLSQLSTAFRVIRPARLAGRHVILVDDVTTTGATLELAAQKLLAAGARRVDAVTFAHTAANTAASQ
jgi:ComF family protein